MNYKMHPTMAMHFIFNQLGELRLFKLLHIAC